MSLYQCAHCGCKENTACGLYWSAPRPQLFDWSGIEERKGMELCSACAPPKFSNGTPTEFGEWHGRFDRVFLPKGVFYTNRDGNLAHKETHETDIKKYAICPPEGVGNDQAR